MSTHMHLHIQNTGLDINILISIQNWGHSGTMFLGRIRNEWHSLPMMIGKNKQMGNLCENTHSLYNVMNGHHPLLENFNTLWDMKRTRERDFEFLWWCKARAREINFIQTGWKRNIEIDSLVRVKGGGWRLCGEEAEGCSNQEQAGEKEQFDRLCFSRAGGAILQCYQYLLMATVTPRNRSFAGKTYMVRSLLNKVRKNLKYYRQGSFDHKIWKYTAINPPNHRTNGIIHSSHVLLNTVTTS